MRTTEDTDSVEWLSHTHTSHPPNVSAHPSSEPTPLTVLTARLPADLVLRQPLTGFFVDDREMEGHC